MSSRSFSMLVTSTVAAPSGIIPTTPTPVPRLTMAVVTVNVTAITDTPNLDVRLQGSPDGGVTWFDIPVDLRTDEDGGTAMTEDLSVVNADLTSSVEKFTGVYKHLPYDTIRARYEVAESGTTSDVTLAIDFAGK